MKSYPIDRLAIRFNTARRASAGARVCANAKCTSLPKLAAGRFAMRPGLSASFMSYSVSVTSASATRAMYFSLHPNISSAHSNPVCGLPNRPSSASRCATPSSPRRRLTSNRSRNTSGAASASNGSNVARDAQRNHPGSRSVRTTIIATVLPRLVPCNAANSSSCNESLTSARVSPSRNAGDSLSTLPRICAVNRSSGSDRTLDRRSQARRSPSPGIAAASPRGWTRRSPSRRLPRRSIATLRPQIGPDPARSPHRE